MRFVRVAGVSAVHGGRLVQVHSKSTPETVYEVTIPDDSDGGSCTCPSYLYRRQPCKHVDMAREHVALHARIERVLDVIGTLDSDDDAPVLDRALEKLYRLSAAAAGLSAAEADADVTERMERWRRDQPRMAFEAQMQEARR